MVRLDRLSKWFGQQRAVDEISFEIPPGQIVGFLGPNGAGKSTTLKMLTGMIEPSSGTANICGFDLRRNVLEVKRHVGFVPESGAVLNRSPVSNTSKWWPPSTAFRARRLATASASSPPFSN
jgi:ABC-2 type transport system ATP-binding protein